MALISQAIATSLKEQDLIPDALENLAKSTVKRATKPEQTSLPLKENRLYYDKEQNDFFLKPQVAEQQLSFEESAESVQANIDEKEEWDFESAEEYCYAVGQMMNTYLSLSKSTNKNLSFINPLLQTTSNE